MITTAITILVYLAFTVFAAKRLMTYLHVLQQDDYDNARLVKWAVKNKVIDTRLTLALVILAVLSPQIPPSILGFLLFTAFILVAYFEKDPRKRSKKKLIATTRAKRIFIPSLLLLMFSAIPVLFFGNIWLWVIAVQIVPVTLILVNTLLHPVEAAIQQKYWDEAQQKLRNLSPTVVAITGSYGKTSVKHILGHILTTQANTLVTPGSTNTAMGTARIIREELDDAHKYVVVEMGAYGPGSIARLCALTPPDIGIITSIGHAHYERFKSLDTVAEAKFELAESVVGRGGIMVVHEKALKFPYPRKLYGDRKDQFVVCHEPGEDDKPAKNLGNHLQVLKIQQHKYGMKVKLHYEKKNHVLELPLFGLHHAHNAALAFAAARQLGIEAANIKTALKSLKQIQHRLEVKRQMDGTVIIDDAFNSNPKGFRAALDLLAVMDGAKRRILITPGMVEMGGTHDEMHEKIGRAAGRICDVVLAVNPKRIPTFVKGFNTTNKDGKLIKVNEFKDAARWVSANKREGDVILIENDLPDMYERVPRI